MFSLLSFIYAVSDYSALTIRHFTVAKWIEHTKKLNYTINYKYALFYLPIHNDGKHQLCISNSSKSHSFGNQYPYQLWCFTQHSIWTKMRQTTVDVYFSLLCIFWKLVQKQLVTVLYRLVKEKWEIQQLWWQATDSSFISIECLVSIWLLLHFTICRYYFEWIW